MRLGFLSRVLSVLKERWGKNRGVGRTDRMASVGATPHQGAVPISDYRELSEYECAVILRLLTVNGLPVKEYSDQLLRCRVRGTGDPDNYGSIYFDPERSLTMPKPVMVDALSKDQDGIPVLVILHAQTTVVAELEFVKADGTPLIERPHPDTFELE
jgi:hypothetical protein